MGAFTMRLLRPLLFVLLLGGVALAQSPTYGVGRTPTPEEIRAWDISISPTGTELPQGHGNAKGGAQVYRAKGCAGCHGTPGKPNESSDTLYPPIPDLPATGTQYSEAQIFWIAKHGIRLSGMFANGKWDSDQKLWTITAYIARIKSLPPRVQEELAKPSPVK